MPLSEEEKIRYSRHLNLPQFGPDAQERLKASRVLVVGAGGLGVPMLQYLTAAGVGAIGIVDFDRVDVSNLQRQVLYDSTDIGNTKVSVAVKKLKHQNPLVEFIEFQETLSSDNALTILSEFDVVADGTDNFPTRYLVNDACVLLGKPYVYASIFQFEGQISVFNYFDGETYGPNYRDLFPNPPEPGLVPNCADGGVLGVLPGVVGSIQAAEVIKVLTGIGTILSGKLLLLDLLDFSSRKMNVRKDPKNPLTGDQPTINELIDYDEFCGLAMQHEELKLITVHELLEWRNSNKPHVLIDVREPYEHQVSSIGGQLIPLEEISQNRQKIPSDRPVVFYCKSGLRSTKAIEQLQGIADYPMLYSLSGGLMAWKSAFDPEMPVV
jgi:molybdopterin/thiamine biosynthesis adenylyltransferase/rhodanese-related sulfurtransferase